MLLPPEGLFQLTSLDRQNARLALAMHDFSAVELHADWHGARLLVAFSGGADSTALLVLAASLREYLGCQVFAAHLDHGLRPSSAREAADCSVLCSRLGVPFHVERRDIASLAAQAKTGIEDTGRRERYRFLEEVRVHTMSDWILTGHHVGDLAEDVLLRLVRGTGWPGLGGMPGRRGRVIRPLLLREKAELEALLVHLSIPWLEDESNSDSRYKRNRVRHSLLPLFLEENPSFYDAVRHLWRMSRADNDYWRKHLEGIPTTGEEGVVLLPHSQLTRLVKAERLRLYMSALERLKSAQARASVLFALDKAFAERRHGKEFQFSGGTRAVLDGEGITFRLDATK